MTAAKSNVSASVCGLTGSEAERDSPQHTGHTFNWVCFSLLLLFMQKHLKALVHFLSLICCSSYTVIFHHIEQREASALPYLSYSFPSFKLSFLIVSLSTSYYFPDLLIKPSPALISVCPHHIQVTLLALISLSAPNIQLPSLFFLLSPRRSRISSRCVSAAATAWTRTPRCASSACSVRVERASRLSCQSYTAASALAAKVRRNGADGFACPFLTSV